MIKLILGVMLSMIVMVGCEQKNTKTISEAVNIAIKNEQKNGEFNPKDLQNITDLIKNGANPAVRENKKEHFSPLIYILVHPKSDMLKALLDGGFDPNFAFVYDELGETRVPMIFETVNDISHENFKLLINSGVDVNAKIEEENRYLILETALIAPKNTLFLLEKGADFEVKNNNGLSVAYLVHKNIDERETPITQARLREIYPNITPEQIEKNILAQKQTLAEWKKVRDFLVQKGVSFPPETPNFIKESEQSKQKKPKRYDTNY
ncbi:MAG: hypothetical protein Q3971_01335 [Moraxella sp.]|nr:hypothetical protein [Moraxella sp.]